MSLAGSRFGPYEIVSLLGAGGMGEVYRARDTKLGRDVAIKFLPQAWSADPDRLARFEREARVLASLNHPNVGAIYGLEESADMHAIVLELVEGETLADTLSRVSAPGAKAAGLPLGKALAIAKQIAEALDAAHERGIVHRDLKPSNIVITPAGAVKVLDFGLAKVGDGESRDLTHSPTVTGATREGVILGTAAYMSPEQARGYAVDKRTDVWAFGCVLFEMLAGRQAFGAATVSDTIVSILDREPEWRALPAATPLHVRRLLERCLDKDAKRRLRDIGDARIELDAHGPHDTPGLASVSSARRGRRIVAPIAGAMIVASALAGLWMYIGRRPSPPSAPRLSFTRLTSHSGAEWFPSLSPDGKWVAYGGNTAGNRDIFLQSVTGQTPINLTADSPDDDDEPAFSPDGERIAFRSERDGGGIFVMGRTGEAARRLTRRGFRPAWSPDGRQIAFTTEDVDVNPQNGRGPSQLWIVDVMSGEANALAAAAAVQASWSPDGSRIAFSHRGPNSRQMDISTIPVAGGAPATLVTDPAADWNPLWSPDGKHIYFTSDRNGSMNLWRVPVDERSGQLQGDPEALITPAPFVAHPAISADGKRIAYSAVVYVANVQKIAFDPGTASVKGEPSWVTTGSRPWSSANPSPDGDWVTFYSRQQPEGEIYIVRADGTGLRQLTSGALDREPRWSPDAEWISFFSNRSGALEIWKIRRDGSELQQMSEGGGAYSAWSPDGSLVATTRLDKRYSTVLFDPSRPFARQTPEFLPPFADSATEGFVAIAWSPDGRTIAGQVDLNGREIVTYSLSTKKYSRLTSFGEWPAWLPDNRRLVFNDGGRNFWLLDTVSKETRKIYSGGRDVLGPPRLTRDGRTVYFTRRTTESDIWLLTLQ